MKFELSRLTNYSDNALLDEMKRVASLLAVGAFTTRQFNELSKVHSTAIARRFGSWASALERAGLATTKRQIRHFSDQQLFENLLTVWTYYGRPPKFKEMASAPSKYGGKPYVSRFGSWRIALGAFVDRVNSDKDDTPEIAAPNDAAVGVIGEHPRSKPEEDRREIRLGLRFAILQRDRFCCIACGTSPATNPGCVLHVDHILPFSKGGKTLSENLRTLCANCNIGRGNRFQD